MKTLLEKAKEYTGAINRNRNEYSHDDVELALAWLKSEVSGVQVLSVIGRKYRNNLYSFISQAIKYGFKKRLIRGEALRYFRPLQALSPDARAARKSDWSPEYLGAIHDPIETKPLKHRIVKSRKLQRRTP